MEPSRSHSGSKPGDTAKSRVATLRRIAASAKRSRFSAFAFCKSLAEGNTSHRGLSQFFNDLPVEDRHYWIASLYALLMPKGRRRKLSAYFTPPHLASHALQVLVDNGIVLGKHRILDPASGGAAFLVPLAAWISKARRRAGDGPKEIISKINRSIAGIEIDTELATLSKLLLEDILKIDLAQTRKRLNVSITHGDTLALPPKPIFEAVIVNPPYGRVFRPNEKLLTNFSDVITDNYVNRYALFIKQALGWVKPDGVVCLIIPMSFLGGPYFSSLRQYILSQASVISLDPIEQRSELFLDVLCDVCVLTIRKHGIKKWITPPTSSLQRFHELPLRLGSLDVPATVCGRIWALPNTAHSEQFFESGYESLESYGYTVKTGYFVWNREKDRYRIGFKPRVSEVPLYWAHNVRANAICKPLAKHPSDGDESIGFATIDKRSTGIVRSDAIIVQRTSNSRQKRRLIAAIVRQLSVPGQRGFVSENHTLLIVPSQGKDQTVKLAVLCRLLNSEAVDSRFRRISGTVSVSVSALRALPLPLSKYVNSTFGKCPDDDCAAHSAYLRSASDINPGPPPTRDRTRGSA